MLPPITISSPDAIASSLNYNSSINTIRPPSVTNDFGRTASRIEVNKSSVTPARGTFDVKLVIDHAITYWVAGNSRTDIASDSDSDISQVNYPKVVSDLTPPVAPVNVAGMVLLKNQPPRRLFWAEDLTVKHERFHAAEHAKFGQEGAILGHNWLNTQTAQNDNDLVRLLGKVSQMVADRIDAAMTPPGVEQRAYDDGAADYLARAQAIKNKGDAKGYVSKPAPQLPKSPPSPTPKAPTPSPPPSNEPIAK